MKSYDDKKRKEIADSIIKMIASRYVDSKNEAIIALYQVTEFFQIVTGKQIPESVKADITERLEKTLGPKGTIEVDLNQDRWEAQQNELMYG
jgi:hypothetical protein